MQFAESHVHAGKKVVCSCLNERTQCDHRWVKWVKWLIYIVWKLVVPIKPGVAVFSVSSAQSLSPFFSQRYLIPFTMTWPSPLHPVNDGFFPFNASIVDVLHSNSHPCPSIRFFVLAVIDVAHLFAMLFIVHRRLRPKFMRIIVIVVLDHLFLNRLASFHLQPSSKSLGFYCINHCHGFFGSLIDVRGGHGPLLGTWKILKSHV